VAERVDQMMQAKAAREKELKENRDTEMKEMMDQIHAQEQAKKQEVDFEQALKEWQSQDDMLSPQSPASPLSPGSPLSPSWEEVDFIGENALFISQDKSKGTVFDEKQMAQINDGQWDCLGECTTAALDCRTDPVNGDCVERTSFDYKDKQGIRFRPNEPKQSSVLGDCWLISAIATVATRPEMLEKVFVKTDAERGLYGIRLFDQVWE